METKLEMKSFSAVPKGFPVQEMNFFSLCVLRQSRGSPWVILLQGKGSGTWP